MSEISDRVYARLKHLKAERRVLGWLDFADLGSESDTIYRCLTEFEDEQLVQETLRPRYTSNEGTRVIADFSFRITDEGRAGFND